MHVVYKAATKAKYLTLPQSVAVWSLTKAEDKL